MNFNSLQFLIFLPIVLCLYWLLPHKLRWAMLLIASYYFYMSWNAWLVFAILGTTIVSYGAGLLLGKIKKSRLRKLVLAVTVIVCIGTLVFFKYFNFLLQSAIDFLNLFSLNIQSFSLDLILPVGISFYTFQTLSYVIDVYREKFTPEKHFGYYALFVSYFPQLVAGPIEKPQDLLPQLKREYFFNGENMLSGFKILLCGFFMKCVVADYCGTFVINVFNNIDGATGLSVFIACFLFSAQMFCDFAGYSNIAIGCARMMGVKLTKNFDKPYLSLSFTEFARRWHITLNRWFIEYVYIPLGGSRKGRARQLFNILFVFVLSGMWHGANWTFVLWGLYLGVMGCIESLLAKPVNKFIKAKGFNINRRWITVVRYLCMGLLSVPVSLMFRAQSIGQIGELLSKITVFGLSQTVSSLGMGLGNLLCVVLGILCMSLIQDFAEEKTGFKPDKIAYVKNGHTERSLYAQKLSVFFYAVLAVGVFWLALLASGDVSAFQYFQF